MPIPIFLTHVSVLGFEKSHQCNLIFAVPSKPDTSDEPVALENKSFESKVDQEEEEEIVDPEMEHCQEMHYKIVKSIIESETLYLDCLKTLVQVSCC